MTRSERRQLKLKYIREKTKDPKIHDKARDWGWKRLKSELDVYPPKKVYGTRSYRIATPKKPTRKYSMAPRAIRERERYSEVMDMGFTSKAARTMRGWGKPRIEEQKTFHDRLVAYLKAGHISKPKDSKERDQRFGRWDLMSLKDLLPQELRDYAKDLNRENNRTDSDSFGYAYLAYWFAIGGNIEDYKEKVKVDDTFSRDHYVTPFFRVKA